MRGGLALAVTLSLIAGCAAPGGPVEDGTRPTSLLEIVDIGTGAYEPSIGLASGNAIFVNAHRADGAPAVWRSQDLGATWDEVMEDAERAPASSDPWLYVDHASDRVFSAELQLGGCSWLTWSDDGGETWEKNVAGGCGLPSHHFQKLTGGPPPEGIATEGYPSVLYYSSTSLRDPDPTNPTDLIVGGTGTDIAVSLDGGRTFSLPVRVHPPTPGGYSQAGPVAVGLDGRAWSPAQTDEGVRIARTSDAGATWELVATLNDAGYQPYGSDPSLAVDGAGTLYLLHPSKESAPVLRTSRDGGATWSSPHSIAPPAVNATIFPLVRTVGNGSIVVAYLGTTADASAWDADPSYAPPSADWQLHVALIDLDVTGEPRTRAAVSSGPEDPVQRGCIWMRGGTSSCRNLGDFFGLDVRDGLAVIALVDGCDACPSGAQSTGTEARVAMWRPPS